VDDAHTRGRGQADGEARRRHLPNLARQGYRKHVLLTPAIMAAGVCYCSDVRILYTHPAPPDIVTLGVCRKLRCNAESVCVCARVYVCVCVCVDILLY
jgi:hypothetical protein